MTKAVRSRVSHYRLNFHTDIVANLELVSVFGIGRDMPVTAVQITQNYWQVSVQKRPSRVTLAAEEWTFMI